MWRASPELLSSAYLLKAFFQSGKKSRRLFGARPMLRENNETETAVIDAR